MHIRLRGHHPPRPGIQSCSSRTRLYHSRRARRNPVTRSHNPNAATPDGYHTTPVWPDPLSLATTHGTSFPTGTEMFHFPAYPPARRLVPPHQGWRVPPFGDPGIKALSAAPPGLSRPHTSFIGPVRQGIHHCALTSDAPASPAKTKFANTSDDTSTQHVKMITKRPNEHPRNKSRSPFEINRNKKKTLSCSRPLSSSQTTNTHRTHQRPHQEDADEARRHRTRTPEHPHGKTPAQAPGSGDPGTQKHAIPPTPATPTKGNDRKPMISSTPATPTPCDDRTRGAHTGRETLALHLSVERR